MLKAQPKMLTCNHGNIETMQKKENYKRHKIKPLFFQVKVHVHRIPIPKKGHSKC